MYAQSILCCCFHKQRFTHIYVIYIYIYTFPPPPQKSTGRSIYSNTTLGRWFPERNWQCLLRPPPPSLHCFPVVFALVYSSPYLIPESTPQRQAVISHVGAFVLLNLSTPLAQKVWGTGQPRASATSFSALPLTLIFWKWVCCHSNCQITSIMPPLTSQHLL